MLRTIEGLSGSVHRACKMQCSQCIQFVHFECTQLISDLVRVRIHTHTVRPYAAIQWFNFVFLLLFLRTFFVFVFGTKSRCTVYMLRLTEQ